MQIHLSRPDISQQEIDAVCDVLRSPNLSLGPKLPEFESRFAEYIGTKRAVAVNSGTSGLFLCLKSLGLGVGDEVITTPFTFIASTTSIMMTGATPVFVDIDPDSLNIDPQQVAEKITPRTKAILPVEVFGNPSGMDAICHLAKEYNLAVVEDSCEGLGTLYREQKAGSFGTMSVFAFYPNKQMTTGEGGMILTDDDALADHCVSLRNQGRSLGDTWLSHDQLGYNFRLSDINCALGIVQLSRIEEFVEKRIEVARQYHEQLKHEHRLVLPTAPENSRMSWFVYVVRLTEECTQVDRDHLLNDLRQQGIQVSNYFPPVHLQPFISQQFGFQEGDFPITEFVSQRTIALPFYNNLDQDDIQTVCRCLHTSLDRITTQHAQPCPVSSV